MADPQLVAGILGFIALSVPIIGSLWRVFAIREKLQTEILVNRHRIELLEQQISHLVNQQTLALNGLTEKVQHVHDRTLHAEGNLNFRLEDVESFMEKSTSFTKRRRA